MTTIASRGVESAMVDGVVITAAPALSLEGSQFVAVASVLGGAFSLDDVGEALGTPTGKLLGALRELFEAGVVAPSGHALSFADELVREEVYGRIPEPVRLALHRDIGMMLLERGGEAVPAAEHLIRAARPGDRHALDALDRAAEEAKGSTPARAAEFALRALELTGPHDDARGTRAINAVSGLVSARRLGDATALARLVLADDGLTAAASAGMHLMLASILFVRGCAEDAVREAEVVIEQPGLPDDCYVAAELARLFGLLAGDDFALAREPAMAILAGGDRTGSDHALAGALTALSFIAWSEGRVADAHLLMQAAVKRTESVPLEGRRGQPRLALAPMLAVAGDLAAAEVCIDEAARELESAGESPWVMAPPIFRARVRLLAGRLGDAAASAECGLHTTEEVGAPYFLPLALSTLGAIALLRDDIPLAAQFVARYRAEPPAPRVGFGSGSYAFVEGRVVEAQAGPRAAMDVLAPVYDDLDSYKRLLLEEPAAAAWLVRTALAAGDTHRAEAVVASADRLAADNPDFAWIAGCAMHATGLLTREDRLLQRAAALQWQPFARGSAFEDAGVVLRSAGGIDAAREQFAAAIVEYERAGAERDVRRVRARMKLGQSGRRARRPDRPVEGWESLTAGEHRVAQLVARGLTNRDVAQRMFLSRHTIDFHLRQAFRKLGVSSRVELTRIAMTHANEE